MKDLDFETTEEIEVPKRLIDQVIGQDKAVEIIKRAAMQKRHVLLVGPPGTGKSMLAQAMSELLPTQELEDILVAPNPEDPNRPKVIVVKAGEGRKYVERARLQAGMKNPGTQMLSFILFPIMIFFALLAREFWGDVISAAFIISFSLVGAALMFAGQFARMRLGRESEIIPKIIVDNSERKKAPFVDATGAKAGALLGDVKHDPFQSGGLGTPAHLRVVPGMIHKAHKGVLFIDEISSLSMEDQQELLTAMQEKKMAITGRSPHSSGAMVMTEPVPCDFVLVAAGNVDDLKRMHPALRSRIRGYGYEVYMNEDMPDTPENRAKIARFVAQEVVKDGKIPHFTREAVIEIIKEARRMAGKRGRLTLKLRELGGLIRAAGDIARQENAKYVLPEHVRLAKEFARTLEHQIAERYVETKKEYQVILSEGSFIGRVNGLAVFGNSGIIIPIEASVTPAASREKGRIIATGRLGEIAKEAVENVSAIIKKVEGERFKNYDIHVQFLQTYEGVEGDSASISVAVAVLSAIYSIPVRQDVAMTGSLSVLGEVLPVGAVNEKIEAAYEAGIRKVIIPKANEGDVNLPRSLLEKIEIFAVSKLSEVVFHAFKDCREKNKLIKKLRSIENVYFE